MAPGLVVLPTAIVNSTPLDCSLCKSDLCPLEKVNATGADPQNNAWWVEFTRNDKYDLTGEGDAMRIFATVLKLTQDFIKKENPKYIEFSSSKLRDPGESRNKLYDRMVKKYAGSKYNIQSSKSGDDTTWRLTRK